MNNDLISRSALLKDLKDMKVEGEVFTTAVNFAIEVIDNAPTVAERPQGEWITRHKLNSFGQDVVCFECNKCGEYKVPLYHLLITEPLKVCPNCGADMRKGGAE